MIVNIIFTLASYGLLFVLIVLMLLGFGTGVGYLFHWLLPRVEFGMAVLIGVLATGMGLDFLGRLLAAAGLVPSPRGKQDEDDQGRYIVLPIDPADVAPRRRRRWRKESD